MITKYKLFENINIPLNGVEPFVFSNWFSNNYDMFIEDILNDMKEKLIGNTIYLDGVRKYRHDETKDDLIDTINFKPLYKIIVKDVVWNGTYRGNIRYVNIIDSEDKIYTLKKIVNETSYNRWRKKVSAELEKIETIKRKKEKLRLKHIVHDPYGEEKWEDDD